MSTESLESFRQELRQWLDDNCPASLRTLAEGNTAGPATAEERKQWLDAMASRGYTTPT
jgi:acyl-CoA dehydrogenase